MAPATDTPGPTSTGTDSPVSIEASTADVPLSTTPSVATFSPGRTTNRSPTRSSATGTLVSTPSRSTVTSLAPSSISARSAAPARRFERFSNQRPAEQERRHPGRGLEVDVVEPVGPLEGEPERVGHADHAGAPEEERDQRPAERRQHADRDERVHGGAAVPQVHQRGPVERPRAPDDDGRGQGQRQPLPAVDLERRHHRHQHDRHGEQRRDQQPLAERSSSGSRSSARRPPAPAVGSGRRTRRRRRSRGARRCVTVAGWRDPGALGRVVDAGGDAVELVELALDAVGARRAGHAGDVELDPSRLARSHLSAGAVAHRQWSWPPSRVPSTVTVNAAVWTEPPCRKSRNSR